MFKIILLFAFYAIFGWILEISYCYFIQHKFLNRGFLIGPYCPIYAWGSLTIYFLLDGFKNNIFILYLMTVLICSIIEYLSGYFMNKIFHLRWWDYSNKKFNLNGYICLDNMILFGIIGILVIYIINPILLNILNLLPLLIINILALIFIIIFALDNLVSFYLLFKYNKNKNFKNKDNTEEIITKIRIPFLNNKI